MGARGKLFLLSVLLVVVNIEVISGQGTQCPENNEGLAVHLPHEANCSLFYQCDWGVAILKECPAGLHFNPVLQVCDWPANAGCQSEGDVDGNGGDDSGNGDGDNGDNSDGNGEGDNGGSGDGDNDSSEDDGDSDVNGGSSEGNECPADNEGDAIHLPHDSDCGLFYQCDWGVAILKECPAGLHFNPVLQVCDWPANAGCQSEGDVDGIGVDNGGNGDGDNGDNSDGNGQGDNGGSGDGDNDSSEDNGDSDVNGGSSERNECPADNEGDAIHLPHDSDCGLFYQCDWGVAILKECPAGLHFNPVLQVCDWPANAGCQSEGDVDGNGGDNSGNGDGDNGDNSDGNGESDNGGSGDGDNDSSEDDGDSDVNDGTNGGNECPADNEGDAVHLPHDSDCGLFYQCDWGVAILKECPAGLHFNPVLQVCDWPANAGCQSEGDVDGNGGDDSGNGDGDNGDNSDGNGESDNGGSGDGDNDSSEDDGDSDVNGGSSEGNECPADNEGDAIHLPHDSDCGLFYQCDWGVAILKECPAGLHFNPVLQVCDWPTNAGCQSEGDVDGNGGDNSGNGDGDNGDNSDGNGESDNGGSGDGDNDSSEDDGDSDVNGGSSEGNECPADNEGDAIHLPHDSDCGLFYQCDWGVAILKECPAGLHFNPVLQVCDWPANAGCQSEGDVDGNGGDNSGNGDGDNGDNSDGNGEGDNGGSGDGDNDSSEDDGDSDVNGGTNGGNECPADNEGDAVHLPHDSDCGLFYQCDWGVAILKECPAGLHFNPVLQVCDWPDNAGCQSGGDNDGNGGDDGDNGDNSGGNGEGDNDGSSDGDSDSSEGDGGSGGNGGNSGENECPADNEGDAVHLPHESDCSLFYQCDWGVAVLKECPAGLHFNPVLQVCDWPNSAGCQSGGGDDGSVGDGDNGDNGDGGNDGDGDDDDNGNSSSEEPSTGSGSGFCNSIRCPEENEEYVTFIPNAEDCTRFCKCNWGLAYEFVCPAGLFFNPALNVCDYPERAGCNSS